MSIKLLLDVPLEGVLSHCNHKVPTTRLVYRRKEHVFSQGDRSDSIFLVESGKVTLSVVSARGKEAIIAVVGAHDFFGEECLVRETTRAVSATVVEDCSLLRVWQNDLKSLLSQDSHFSSMLISHMLSRNLRLQDDLADHFFNHSEKRLARILLQLAKYGNDSSIQETSLKVNQETLAEMVGTTRGRISFFMNKFRDKGFIEYKHGGCLVVRNTLLSILLRD